jgi:hypothetical protein
MWVILPLYQREAVIGPQNTRNPWDCCCSSWVMPFREEKAERLIQAVMMNMQSWLDDLAVIESFAIPGNKGRILHLMANMEQAKRALQRLIDEDRFG